MTTPSLPILPTTVVGSYAIPAWLWAAYKKIVAGGFGPGNELRSMTPGRTSFRPPSVAPSTSSVQ